MSQKKSETNTLQFTRHLPTIEIILDFLGRGFFLLLVRGRKFDKRFMMYKLPSLFISLVYIIQRGP